MMMLTKKSLERRTFLRGMGVAVGLPLLDSMFPALSTAATAPTIAKRMTVIYLPNGIMMDQ